MTTIELHYIELNSHYLHYITVFEPDIRGLWIGTRSKLVIEANLGVGTHLQIGLQNASTYDWLIRIFLSLTKENDKI